MKWPSFHVAARVIGLSLSVFFVAFLLFSIVFPEFELFRGDEYERHRKMEIVWFLLIILSGPLVYFWVAEVTKLEVNIKSMLFVTGGGYAVVIAAYLIVVTGRQDATVHVIQFSIGDYPSSNISLDGMAPDGVSQVALEKRGQLIVLVCRCNEGMADELSFQFKYSTAEGRGAKPFAVRVGLPAKVIVPLSDAIEKALRP